VRFYKFSSPVADWHSWRQADTSAVSRNFVKYGINLLHPVYDDLSNVASGRENPKGLRFVEFPIYNAASAIGYKISPSFSIEKWGRIITIFASLLSLVFIYLITKKYVSDAAGLFAAFFFAFLPYSIYYSRVILPDPFMVMLSISSLWFMSEFNTKKKIFYLIFSTTCFAIALLVKPTAIFFALPIGHLLILEVYRSYKSNRSDKTYFFSVIIFSLSFLPLLLWRRFIQQFPEGIPASTWLLNGDGIRFKGDWFRWLFGERIGKLILGYWGLIFFGVGAMLVKTKKRFVLELLGVSALLYLIIFATGNVRHDYYQIPIIPVVAIYSGIGLEYLLLKCREYNRIWGLPFVIIALLVTFSLSWYEVQGFFNVNHPEIVEAGELVDRIVPWDAKVIAPYGGDTAFLYQTNRQGWPLLYNTNDVNVQVKLGATHYVSTNFDEPTKKIMKECKTIFKNDKFVIIQLKCQKKI